MGREVFPRNGNMTVIMLMRDAHSGAATYIATRTHHCTFRGAKAELRFVCSLTDELIITELECLVRSKNQRPRLHVNLVLHCDTRTLIKRRRC